MIGNNYINTITWKIKDRLNLNPDQERTVRKLMQEEWEDKIASIWHKDDVLEAARSMDIDLTIAQVEEVLKRLSNYHDATMGINWEVIKATIEGMIKE